MKFQPVLKGFLSLLFAALLLAGCANQMQPAKDAIAKVEAALQAAGPDAAGYAPDETKVIVDGIKDMKMKFDQKDYKAVIAAAPALIEKTKTLGATAAANKAKRLAALPAQWTELSTSVPAALASLESRLANPGNADAATVEAAKKTLTQGKNLWTLIKDWPAAGKLSEAVGTANYIKANVDKALGSLGVAT